MINTRLYNIYGGSIPIALDVGPMPDNTYAYGYTDSDGWVVSEARYANAESAKHDARRPQQMSLKANLIPLAENGRAIDDEYDLRPGPPDG